MYKRFRDFFAEHREDLDALIFDIDGTLTTGGRPIPGAAEFIHALQQEGFPYFLLTNDADSSHSEKAAIVRKSGIAVEPEQIISAGDALAEYIRSQGFAGHKFYQCGRMGNPSYTESAGAVIIRDPEKIGECEGVIFGDGIYDWQAEINDVFNFLLQHPGAPVLVGNPDSYWPWRRGFGVGAGGVARFICGLVREAGGETEPFFAGKPYAPIYELVKKRLPEMLPACPDPDMSKIAMLGDSLASDIQGANSAGMLSCLVLTGITTPELAAAAPPHRKPAEIFTSL